MECSRLRQPSSSFAEDRRSPGADFALAPNTPGFLHHKQDKFAEAARWFENAIRMDPLPASAYLNQGDTFAKAGKDVFKFRTNRKPDQRGVIF